jgi:hypothetical protein
MTELLLAGILLLHLAELFQRGKWYQDNKAKFRRWKAKR